MADTSSTRGRVCSEYDHFGVEFKEFWKVVENGKKDNGNYKSSRRIDLPANQRKARVGEVDILDVTRVSQLVFRAVSIFEPYFLSLNSFTKSSVAYYTKLKHFSSFIS